MTDIDVTEKKRKPTMRQEFLARKIVENHGNVSKSMREVGYSVSHSNNPHQVTRTKTFQELMEKYLPEKNLMKKHQEFLNSKRIIKTYQRGDLKEVTEETDPNAVKALDMAYKLKGKYADKVGNSVLIINVSSQAASRYGNRETVHETATPVEGEGTPST